jgi:hypothetical protein
MLVGSRLGKTNANRRRMGEAVSVFPFLSLRLSRLWPSFLMGSWCLTLLSVAQDPQLEPHRKDVLIGRRMELEQVCKTVKEDKKVAVIAGNPGEGKSRIAAEAVSTFHPQPKYAFLDLSGT